MNATEGFLEGDIKAAAELMGMLASEARLQILCRLLDGERSVNDLARACGLSQPSMSQQLKRLKEAGLVVGRRDGQTIFYSVQSDAVAAVLATLHDLYCSRPESAASPARGAGIQAAPDRGAQAGEGAKT
ncbi:ArsR/SmtB family transcription factor [Profundibacterium mesophilum]|uniref:Transcriptional regulator ArsR family protein n=1 Tax=Profundibacterium mesophilum KAUST100406-0324 TaxID=1037889 RepID=A0A921TEC3_9RHOB|nr:metalloregulator ArsR/SmtB family transcription factor [Profundibacterium mesophilum]KAF0677191.1 Transcriptional regulator ArsR family protein [Profundibacterium mesophilum KAUST100406-0324]